METKALKLRSFLPSGRCDWVPVGRRRYQKVRWDIRHGRCRFRELLLTFQPSRLGFERNNGCGGGVQYHVFVTSRWFPPLLALFASTVHIALIGYDYWVAERNKHHFDVRRFLRQDLERPFFEPYGFCGAYVRYTAGQGIALGLDFPAYVAAIVLQSAVNQCETCVDAVTTPRGQILTIGFVFPLWFVVGLTVRRLCQRRWRSAATGRLSRIMIFLGVVPFPIGMFALLFACLGLFVSDKSISFRLAGFAFWMFYISILSAERLRLWRFKLV